MKTLKRLFVLAIALTFTVFANAQKNYNYKLDGPSTAIKTFEVNGVCVMCKQRIESTVNKLPGIWSADWDVNSQTLMVKYNRAKIKPEKIEQQTALAGHDTEKFKAADDVYAALPDCCHYQRKS